MADWTPERLDALPLNTLIDYRFMGGPEKALMGLTGWVRLGSMGWKTISSQTLFGAADPGSIRVVSVPVDALLSKKTVAKAARDPHGAAFDPFARRTIRAAIAHVTGEQ